MQAVVLVGGEGRRLRPLTDTRPKPMVPLVDRPFVAHQLDLLRRHGVRDVVFSCGYRPDAVRAHFGDGSEEGLRLRYVVDPAPLGTAGAVKNAESLLDGGPVLVLNGDILTDLDIGAVVAAHRRAGGDATVVLTPVADPSAFGLVRLRPDRSVEAFVEKPRPEDLRPGEPFLINAGTYLLEPAVLRMIPEGRECSIEREIFPLLAARRRLFGFPSDAYWRDIGTPESYLGAVRDVLAGRVRTCAPSGGPYLGPGAAVSDGAEVDAATALGPGARVGSGARVEGSVLGPGARVDPGARVRDAILGAEVVVGEGASVEPGAVLGDRARVLPGAIVGPGERVASGGAAAG